MPGIYTLSVTDANDCTKMTSISISEPPELNLDLTATEAVCAGEGSGQINSNVSGGVLPYTYSWSNGSSDAHLSNLEGGSYGLSVTDANGCTISATALIEALDVPICNISVLQHPTFLNAANGAAQISTTGGVPPYQYLWSNGATEETLDNLRDGTYSVTVTDANACSSSCQVTLNEPEAAKIGDYVWHDFNQMAYKILMNLDCMM